MPDYPKFDFSEKLSQEQIDFFEQYGFLHFNRFINPESVQLFMREMDTIQQKWIAEDVEKVNGVPIKYGADVDGKKIVQRFAFSSQHSDVLHEFLQDPRFAALFPLLGPDAENARVGENEKDGLVINHYINSATSKFTKMGWHTDSLRDVFYGKKIMPMLNVGVHLTDAIPNNGGLKIIPGTHKQGLFDMLFKKTYYLSHKPDPNEIGLLTKAGDLTVHDGRLWHRVALSPLRGEVSRRKVMYVPVICGEYDVRNENSSTVLYHRFQWIVK
jgi:ectoine hydroxylase